MADAAPIIVAVGGITIANDVLFSAGTFNWKIPIATGLAAVAFAGLQAAVGEPAVMLAWLVLVGSLIVPSPSGGKPFADNLAAWVNPTPASTKGK